MNNIVESNSNPLADAALGYAGRGWRVIPLHSFVDAACTCESTTCTSPAKHPLTPNGVHGATTEQTTINSWWSEADIANVGIATMKPGALAETLLKKYKIYTVAIDGANVHGCRITPNVYTTTEELDTFVKAILDLAKA